MSVVIVNSNVSSFLDTVVPFVSITIMLYAISYYIGLCYNTPSDCTWPHGHNYMYICNDDIYFSQGDSHGNIREICTQMWDDLMIDAMPLLCKCGMI